MGIIATTYIIIGITALTSYGAFQNVDLINKLIFYPYQMKQTKEWWRFVTHGFIHADFPHLIFNMLTFYFFGRNLEIVFADLFGNPIVYPLFYIAALIVSSIPSYFKHQDNRYYRSLGASGAVSAVLFSNIVFDPWQILRLNFVIPVPAILFAVGYIWYSHHMSKKGTDNIGHDAHMWGAVFGLVFPMVMKPGILPYFIQQLSHPHFF